MQELWLGQPVAAVVVWASSLLAAVIGQQVFEELEEEWVGHTQNWFVVVDVGHSDLSENWQVGGMGDNPHTAVVDLQSGWQHQLTAGMP
jgi:hypothetical protein